MQKEGCRKDLLNRGHKEWFTVIPPKYQIVLLKLWPTQRYCFQKDASHFQILNENQYKQNPHKSDF